ncbi:MAG: chromate transporter [bacterium]|nr:chromate transporter [bacterium]
MIYLTLFWTFFKIGAFTFGGGYAMLPLIEEEVMNHGWMSMEELVNFIAVSESTPGPFAVNISTYVGTETAGPFGALCASLGVVLPSFIIIMIVAKCFLAFKNNKIVQYGLSGLRPAVVGLIAAAVISVGKTAFFPDGYTIAVISTLRFVLGVVLFGFMLFATYKKCNPISIIVISAVIGIGAGYLGFLN